ncbi:ABC transporter substrate-binding protein [Terrihabitans sp. B22-R8]|uniref:ABC transporter substrate-binding protein n=1 Tax=Terrihabitans sp. B22-R8 TaxID=3425128 RepID=UPI00403D0447
MIIGRRSLLGGLGVLLASSVFSVPPARAEDPVVVGLLAPLTGNVANFGERFRESIVLFEEQVNAAGGVEGRPLKILIEDDRNSPKEAASIAQKFASTPGLVLTIGSFSTTASLAAAPILRDAKIPQISPSSSHPDFPKFSDYQFRQNTRQDLLAARHGDLVLDKLGAKRIVIPHFQDDWGQVTATLTKAEIEKRGGEVLLVEAIAPNSRDFRPLISKIKSLKPDAIFLPVHYQEAAAFVQQVRQAGVTIPIGAPDPLSNPKFLELAGASAEGILLYTSFFADDPRHADFVNAYKAKYTHLPDQYSGLAWDSISVGVNAIREVIRSGKEVTGQNVRDALANAPAFEGVTGTTKYDENREVNKEITYIRIKNGAYVLDK